MRKSNIAKSKKRLTYNSKPPLGGKSKHKTKVEQPKTDQEKRNKRNKMQKESRRKNRSK